MVFLKNIIEKPITGEWGSEGNKVNILRTTNFTNSGVLDFSKVVKRNISDSKIDKKKLVKGDIIIEKSGGSPKQPVGRVVFFDNEGIYLCNNFTSILRPKKNKVFPKYLHYLLFASHKFGVTSMFQNKTTGIINLQLPRYIDKLQIPLPPLDTQKRIAQILDDAAALRDTTAQLLKEYDLLAQSIFLEMFGDNSLPQVEIDKISTKVTDGTHHTPKYTDTGIPFLRVTDITKSNDSKKFISKEEHLQLLKRCHPEKGDILYTKNGTIGVAKEIDWDYEFSIFVSLCLIKLNKAAVIPKFIESFLNTDIALNQAKRFSKTGTITNLHLIEIKRIKCPLPPIELQNQFAEKIALIEQQKALAKQELQESEDLFDCLLQKAFKGELV